MTPIILLVGNAGSGKDTIAGFIQQDFNAQPIAHADPMKRLAAQVFGFDSNTLWGPSSARNAEIPQSSEYDFWYDAGVKLNSRATEAWVDEVFVGSRHSSAAIMTALRYWLNSTKTASYEAGKLLTARYTLQTLGTEFGRKMGKNVWTDYTLRASFDLLSGGIRYDRERASSPTPVSRGQTGW